MRNVRGVIDDLRTALRENQEFAAVLVRLWGHCWRWRVERYGPTPDQGSVAVTVTQARASLLSALALVFTGLSIVLALTSLTAGSTANMFSKRLLRMQLRRSSDKLVLGVFALTASFIVGSQILLRTRAGDSLAPPLMMIVAVILLMLTGVLIVWYINGTLQSLRVDRVIRWTGRQILRAARCPWPRRPWRRRSSPRSTSSGRPTRRTCPHLTMDTSFASTRTGWPT